MSCFNKLKAVAIGLGSVAEGIASLAIDNLGDKIGKRSVSDSNGNTYTGRDFKNKASNLENKSFKGFDRAIELWKNDKD